jgi:archaemetzincin
MPLPKDSFNPKRNQYFSKEVLKMLRAIHPYHLGPILGVTNQDLNVPDLNFVFGEADPASQVAVISNGVRGVKKRKLFHERAIKEAVHEVGHIYGLGHCANPDCVMRFSNSLSDTDKKGPEFCEGCKTKIDLRK